jgi:intracellular multiplication protein IcmK
MKKQLNYLKRENLAYAIAAALAMLSVGSIAQQAPNSPIGGNPFGSVPQQQVQVNVPNANPNQINYTGAGSLEPQGPIVIPNNISQIQANPALAAQASGAIPPPAGLPNYGAQQRGGMRTDNINAIDAQLEILNTPDKKIRELRRDIYDKSRVINEGATSAPLPTKSVIVAEINPGSTSPVVRVFKNRTSTVIITDMTGQPWPIVNMDGLSNEDFIVKRLDNPAPDGFVLSITPKGTFSSGNLALVLKGLATPINLEFVPAQKEVDVNAEIRVQARGPNTQFSTMSLPNAMDSALLSVLQGVTPKGAKDLKTSSNAVQAWLTSEGSMFVRTRYKVMAPAFDDVTSSPDGTFAYKMVPVPVVLFKTDDGRFGEFTVEGF